uniref:Uncharacterized protein n=1 Tax=Prasinoderma coloniale TaxID=156133 RepID=A0A7R9TCP2_9VIRI
MGGARGIAAARVRLLAAAEAARMRGGAGGDAGADCERVAAGAHAALGKLEMLCGNDAAAQAQYEAALRAFAAHAPARLGLAQLLEARGDAEGAARVLMPVSDRRGGGGGSSNSSSSSSTTTTTSSSSSSTCHSRRSTSSKRNSSKRSPIRTSIRPGSGSAGLASAGWLVATHGARRVPWAGASAVASGQAAQSAVRDGTRLRRASETTSATAAAAAATAAAVAAAPATCSRSVSRSRRTSCTAVATGRASASAPARPLNTCTHPSGRARCRLACPAPTAPLAQTVAGAACPPRCRCGQARVRCWSTPSSGARTTRRCRPPRAW